MKMVFCCKTGTVFQDATRHTKANSLWLWLSFFCLSFARARNSASEKDKGVWEEKLNAGRLSAICFGTLEMSLQLSFIAYFPSPKTLFHKIISCIDYDQQFFMHKVLRQTATYAINHCMEYCIPQCNVPDMPLFCLVLHKIKLKMQNNYLFISKMMVATYIQLYEVPWQCTNEMFIVE